MRSSGVEAPSVYQNSPSRQLFIANTQSAGVEIPHRFGFFVKENDMPQSAVQIEIDHKKWSIAPGAVRGQAIINLASPAGDQHLALKTGDEPDIHVFADDVIYIRGGERFGIKSGAAVNDPGRLVAKAISVTLGGREEPENRMISSAKVTGAEIKELVGALGDDLWVNLGVFADEPVSDAEHIILQANDRFYTVRRDNEDRFYEVTVIFDGEDLRRRFAAGMTVLQAMLRCLPPRDRPHVSDFDLVDANVGTTPLDPALTLKSAGVRDDHVLSITKKNGGGG